MRSMHNVPLIDVMGSHETKHSHDMLYLATLYDQLAHVGSLIIIRRKLDSKIDK